MLSANNWRNLPFTLTPDDEAAAKECIALARKVTHTIDGVPEFNAAATRTALEIILQKHPNYFYAEFLLSQWHRANSNLAEADILLNLAYAHAPAILVQPILLPDTHPLANTRVSELAIECNRVQNGSLDPSLVLPYRNLRTDSHGNLYLPTYNTVYRLSSIAYPAGYTLTTATLGWFQTSKKVAILPTAIATEQPGAFAPADPDGPTTTTATLPGGITANLLAIANEPDPKDVWWLPDGSLSPTTYRTTKPGMSPWPEGGRRFLFRFSKAFPDDSHLQFRFSTPITGITHAVMVRPQDLDTPLTVFVTFPTQPKHTSIRIGLASTRFETLATFDPATNTTTGKLPEGFAIKRSEGVPPGTVQFEVSHPPIDLQLRVVALDLNGKEFAPATTWFSGDGTTQTENYRFNKLPLAQIKTISLLARPYHFSDFQNIALVPTTAALPTSQPTTQPVPTTAATKPTTFKYDGTTIDDRNDPIPAATITHRSADGKTFNATSDTTGHFSITFDRESDASGLYLAATSDRLGYIMFQANAVHPAATTNPSPLRVTLRPTRQLPVTIATDKGAPVAGALITATMGFTPLADATSDAQGNAILQLPADAPVDTLVAFKPGIGLDYFLLWTKDSIRKDPYHLEPAVPGPIHFILNGVKPLNVRVIDEHGDPLAGADVQPWYFEKPDKGGYLNVGLHSFVRATDPQGRAALDYLPADNTNTVTVWVKKDGYSSPDRWVYNLSSPPNERIITLQKLVQLAGRVLTDDGKPKSGATVLVSGTGYQFDTFGNQTTSDDKGNFTLSVEAERFYLIRAQSGTLLAQTRCVIHGQSPQPLQLRLSPAQRVFGQFTAGPDNKPVRNALIEFVFSDENSYDNLPKDQQLTPPPAASGPSSVQPAHISQASSTNADGSFEFFTVPGRHYLRGQVGPTGVLQHFTLDDTKERRVDLHAQNSSDAPMPVQGKTVNAVKPNTPVGEVDIEGDYFDSSFTAARPTATSDKKGQFALSHAPTDFFLAAITRDRKLGTLRTVRASEDPIVLSLEPTAAVTGRLTQNGQPQPGVTILWHTLVPFPNGGGISCYRNVMGGLTTTDALGNFTVDGLLVGHKYHLVTGSVDQHGTPLERADLTDVQPEKPETRALGDLTATPPATTTPSLP